MKKEAGGTRVDPDNNHIEQIGILSWDEDQSIIGVIVTKQEVGQNEELLNDQMYELFKHLNILKSLVN